MNPFFKYFPIAAVICLGSCFSLSKSDDNSQIDKTSSVSGSWFLTKYKPEGSDKWFEYSDSIRYEKHLADNHFIWYSYDEKNNELLGMGGGTYSIHNGTYVENIKFFYPPGSSELGQSIPFSLSIQNGTWNHVGYAKVVEFDPESAEPRVTDSSKIEEKWKRINITPNKNRELVGAWDLVSYRESENGNYIEYPGFVEYIKLLTPTNFTWVYYNKDQDEIYAAGSGSYAYGDGTYSEAIKMMYPNQGEIGSTVLFKSDVQNNKWKHLGFLTRREEPNSSTGMVIDSVLIDEIWTTHKETE